MTEQQPWGAGQMATPSVTPPSPGSKWYAKKGVQLAAAGLIGLIVGAASAGGGGAAKDAGPTQAQLDAANKSAADAQAAASAAESKAQASVAAEMQKLAAQKAALDAREKKVSGMEAAAKANEFDGSDGMYLVSVDIKPGTYRGTASDGCYYARLSSVNTQDIIENNNTDGPVVVRIRASDKAFQVARCGTFTRIGD